MEPLWYVAAVGARPGYDCGVLEAEHQDGDALSRRCAAPWRDVKRGELFNKWWLRDDLAKMKMILVWNGDGCPLVA